MYLKSEGNSDVLAHHRHSTGFARAIRHLDSIPLFEDDRVLGPMGTIHDRICAKLDSLDVKVFFLAPFNRSVHRRASFNLNHRSLPFPFNLADRKKYSRYDYYC